MRERGSLYSMRAWVNSVYDRDNLEAAVEPLREVAPQLALLESFGEAERQMDEVIRRRRADLLDLHAEPPALLRRVLRVHLLLENVDISSQVRVRGYLLAGEGQRLTEFLRSVEVSYLNYDEESQLLWRRPAPHPDFREKDGLLFRLPVKAQDASVNLNLLFPQEKYRLDPFLQKIVGLERATRVEVTELLWRHILDHKLLEPDSK
jgi:hypothetical protein